MHASPTATSTATPLTTTSTAYRTAGIEPTTEHVRRTALGFCQLHLKDEAVTSVAVRVTMRVPGTTGPPLS